MERRSPQKNHTTAKTVPVWMAASKESPKRPWSMPEEVLAKEEVPGAGDREKLGQALHHAQEDGF